MIIGYNVFLIIYEEYMKIFIILGLIFSFINLSYSKECSGKWSNTVKMSDTIDLGEGTTSVSYTHLTLPTKA